MPRQTHAFKLAQQPLAVLCFSGAVASSSVYLPGAGGVAGDGFPVPYNGYALSIHVWDGSTMRSDSAQIALTAYERLSVYCTWTGTDFTVRLRIDGVNSSLQVTAVPGSSSLTVTISLTQTIV